MSENLCTDRECPFSEFPHEHDGRYVMVPIGTHRITKPVEIGKVLGKALGKETE